MLRHFPLLALSTLAWFAPQMTLAQRDFSNVEIIAHHVAGSVYYLEGAGGNIGLSVGEDGVVMIDDQFAPLTDKILAAIRQLNQGEIRLMPDTGIRIDFCGQSLLSWAANSNCTPSHRADRCSAPKTGKWEVGQLWW